MPFQLSPEIEKQIQKAARTIRKGGLVAFPTDTVYGLGAGAYIESAIKRVYEVKQRPFEMALPLLLGDIAQIHEVADHVPDYGWRLIDRFLPGGLTLVVYRTKIVKDIITAGGETVAIRVPNHPVILALIRESGMPVVGTSANRSGMPSALTPEDVRTQLDGQVDFVLEGGPRPGGKESSVVDVTGEFPVLLREGAIPRSELERVAIMGQNRKVG